MISWNFIIVLSKQCFLVCWLDDLEQNVQNYICNKYWIFVSPVTQLYILFLYFLYFLSWNYLHRPSFLCIYEHQQLLIIVCLHAYLSYRMNISNQYISPEKSFFFFLMFRGHCMFLTPPFIIVWMSEYLFRCTILI